MVRPLGLDRSAEADFAGGPLPGRLFQDSTGPHPRHWAIATGELSETFDRNLRTTHLGTALRELPPVWRTVVEQYDRRHRGMVEIADELGLSLEEIRTILNSARARLWLELVGDGSSGQTVPATSWSGVGQ